MNAELPSAYPLSYGQRALWYVQQMIPGSSVYNLQSTWRILSDVDIPALRRTFQWLVDRHDSLRTTCGLRDREPVQFVHPHREVHFRIHDTADLSEAEFKAEVDREAVRPFDLEKGPLMRANLFLREPGSHILLTSFHHIIVDLWSMTLIYEELQKLYPAAREGKTPSPPPEVRYTDYVAWQNRMLAGPEGERLRRYWARQFEDDVRQLELPTDFIPSSKPSFDGGAFPFKLDCQLTSRLRELGRRTHSTLYTVLLAGFEALLHLMTGRDKFLIRTLTVGRSRSEHEKIVGFFANPVVLRVDFSDDPDIIQAITRAQKSVTEAIEHQDFPFEYLREKLRVGKHLGVNPMSEVMFILLAPQRFVPERRGQKCCLESGMFAPGGTGVRVDFGGMLAEKFNPRKRSMLNDLDLQTVEIGGELSGVIYYRKDLFRPETAERLAMNLKRLLELALDNPDTKLGLFAERLCLPRLPTIRALDLKTTGKIEPVTPSPGPSILPQSALEKQLTRIWKIVLGQDPLCVSEDFFECGGNSLLALQLIVLIREAFQVDLPLRRLFETPTIAGLAAFIENAEKSCSFPALRRVEREKPLLLSFAQERLWFIDRLMGGSTFYNMPIAVRLLGPLDVQALERSLNEVIRRHESLRTVFRDEEGKPVQAVSPRLVLRLPVEDLSPLPAREQEAEVRNLISNDSGYPFDLCRGPLLRIRLLKLASENHLAVLVIHHIAADAWSLGVLVRELAAIYESFSNGKRSPLPDPAFQYADYASWQRQVLRGELLEKQLGYWKETLAGLPMLELPLDHPRPPVQTFRGGARSFEISAALARSLKSLSAREGVTVFMTLLAAFKALLHLVSGQDDIALGTPVAGRNSAETEGMIGFFLNLIVLRTDLAGNPSFRELLCRTRETCLSAFANQDVPFERIVEDLKPDRDLSREPLFQTMFILQNAPMPSFLFPGGLSLSPLDIERESTRYDLTLFLAEFEEKILGWLEYNKDLFEPGTIDRMAERYQRILQAVAEDPEVRVSDLPFLSREELDTVLHRWNSGRSDFPADKCMHELFEAQVELSPEAPAVLFSNRTLTYRELDDWADRVAGDLVNQGAGPETIAAVCMENTPAVLAAVLGVFKAGAAFAAIDSSLPDERAAFVLGDCRAGWLLTDEKMESRWKNSGRPVLYPEKRKDPSSRGEQSKRTEKAAPGNLAYVIYTSGSTGTPKGVMVTHRSLVNYLFWAAKTYQLELGTGSLHHSSVAFDFSMSSLLAPLIAGQKVIMATPGVAGMSLEFEREKYRDLSLLKLTPAHAEVLAEVSAPAELEGWTRTLVLGGEELRMRHIAKWRQASAGTKIFNEYGPTEATVGCAAFLVPEAGPSDSAVPIGRPIDNAEVYILNKYLKPVPPGVPGELWVGGEGVARGYLGRTSLTDERFIPNPFRRLPGARIYRTGDLAKYLVDGTIICLGRMDDQFKVRGYRIEPGEIETALAAHPGVSQAVILARADAGGGKKIAACVAVRRRAKVSAEELRAFLREKLPEHMLPSAFAFLDALPRLPNGKIDRPKLAKIADAASETSKTYLPAKEGLQEQIAAIWGDILGAERIGVHDSFFDLGGNSLLAIRVQSRLRRDFQAEVPLLMFFETPTVARLAELVEQARLQKKEKRKKTAPSRWPELRPGGKGPPLFCIHPSGGDVAVYRHLAKALAPGFPVIGIPSRAIHDAKLEHPSLESMAEEYAGRIRGRQACGPYRLLGWSMGGAIALAVCAALEKKGEQVGFLGLLDADFHGERIGSAQEGFLCRLELILQASAGRGQPESLESILGKTDDLRSFYDSVASLSPEKRAEKLARRLAGGKRHGLKIPPAFLKNLIMLLDTHRKVLADFQPQRIGAPLFIWKAGQSPERKPRPVSSSGVRPIATGSRRSILKRGTSDLPSAKESSRPGTRGGELDFRRVSSGPVLEDTAEGTHFTMLLPPHVLKLAEKISSALNGPDLPPSERGEA